MSFWKNDVSDIQLLTEIESRGSWIRGVIQFVDPKDTTSLFLKNDARLVMSAALLLLDRYPDIPIDQLETFIRLKG